MSAEYVDLTPEQIAVIEDLPCDMRVGEVYDFAWCTVHDTTFPLGSVCRFSMGADR